MGLERIDKKTRIWTSDLDIVLPIDGRDVPEFSQWVNWSGWKGYSQYHTAYDFAAYLDNNGNCVLGLPKETPVRAISDGLVAQVSTGLAGEGVPYATFINVEHAEEQSGLFSAYHHVYPLVSYGQKVKKGDVIATLHKDEGENERNLVHLHFEMSNGWNIRDRNVNPEDIYPLIRTPKAESQGSKDFRLIDFQEQPRIIIANFKKLLVDNS